MKELHIFAQGGIWHVEHLDGGQPDAEVAVLFDGHHVIPTPYTTSIPMEVVASDLRRRNPDKLVTSTPKTREQYAREAHERLGIAYRPDEARGFA